MKDNSALILGDRRSGLVAGLQWQFVCGADTRSQIQDIRRQAAELDVKSCVRLGRQQHAYAGFYGFDATVSDERRPSRVYSFAALLSHRLHAPAAVVAWRVQQGTHQGLYAVVVTQDHLPVADLVLPLGQARTTVARYLKAHEPDGSANFWSNDIDEFPQAQPLLLDWPEVKPGKNERIRDIPSDPVNVATALTVSALLVSGLLAISEYSGYRERMQADTTMAQQKNAQAYDRALQTARLQLGATGSNINRLLDAWMDEPAVLANWSLTNVLCDAQHCMQQWQTEGGYTSELDAAMKPAENEPVLHQTVMDVNNPRRMQVRTARQLEASGVSGWDELPDAKSLQQLLFDESQVWTKAHINHRIDIQGAIWPPGHEPVAGQPVVRRHEVVITAPPHIITHMLQDYSGLAWWNRMQLHVRPFDPNNALLVELQGAFYAY